MRDVLRKLYVLGINIGGRELIALLTLPFLLSLLFPFLLPVAFLFPLLFFIFLDFLYRRKLARIGEELPRFVHLASTYPLKTLKDVVALGKRGFGPLSGVFQEVDRLHQSGIPLERAMRSVAERWGSDRLKKVFSALIIAFRTGVPGELLRNLSEELYFVDELEKERRGAISLHRYSILFSFTLLVPFILAMVVKLVGRLGAAPTGVEELVPLYLVILSLISGLFLAWSEGNPKNSPLYIVLGTAAALAVYAVVLWWS